MDAFFVDVLKTCHMWKPRVSWSSPSPLAGFEIPSSRCTGHRETERLRVELRKSGGHQGCTPPKFNSSPLKNDGWKMSFLLGFLNFRGKLLNFRGVEIIQHKELGVTTPSKVKWCAGLQKHSPAPGHWEVPPLEAITKSVAEVDFCRSSWIPHVFLGENNAVCE